MKDCEFVFNYVHSLHYKCHNINPDCDGSNIDSLELDEKQKSNNKSYQ